MATFKNTTIDKALTIARGTIAQRPPSPQTGMIRWNTDLDSFEYYNGSSWIDPDTGSPPICKKGNILHYNGGNRVTSIWVDRSGRRDATANNSPTWSTSNGGILEFNGSNQWLDTGNNYTASDELPVGNNPYTIEAWIYVRSSQGSTTDADGIIGHGSSYGIGIQVGETGGSPRINYGARSTSNFYGNTFSYNTWFHTIWSRNSSNTKLWENGTLVVNSNTTSYNIGSTPTNNMQIGYCGPRVSGYFDGYIGEVRLYNFALSEDQALNNFNATRSRYGV